VITIQAQLPENSALFTWTQNLTYSQDKSHGVRPGIYDHADHGSMAPSEIWAALDVSRQGAIDLLNPLLSAGLVERTGGKKTGRYRLRQS
jgi:hypothetical protein